ncbi:hypothetical protein [Rhizobium sp. G21]|uniref:hypothetical protein n=1 Tax=Rhizobium sp. G21 TaxID=2758439 RepID=UPI001FF03045|nr:hypothetical protein [Rhizobium sp. G21]
MMTKTPNFAGWRAMILSQEDGNTDKLTRQLKLLGLDVTRQWRPLDGAALPDLVLVDADQGWDELLPWRSGRPARPVIALLGSEAPGRIAWAIGQGQARSSPSRFRRPPSIRPWFCPCRFTRSGTRLSAE